MLTNFNSIAFCYHELYGMTVPTLTGAREENCLSVHIYIEI